MMGYFIEEEHQLEAIEEIKKANFWISNIKCIQCQDTPRIIFNEHNLTYTIICETHKKENVPIFVLYEDYINFENYICSMCFRLRSKNIIIYKCLLCQKYYCNLCLKKHKKRFESHDNYINCNKIHSYCGKHNILCDKYCNICQKKLCKVCIEEKIKCKGEEQLEHKLVDINEIIPNKTIISRNNKIIEDIGNKINLFKEIINDWKKNLEKRVNELLLSIDKMGILYKSFGDFYQFENYFEYKTFLNYNNINIINNKWNIIIEEWNKRNNFSDFYKNSISVF